MVGNAGRMLDPRRTPVSVVAVRLESGSFVLRIDAFEDAGARWELALWKVDRCQFKRGSARAGDDEQRAMTDAIARLKHPLRIEADVAARERTRRRLASAREVADGWLAEHSRFLSSGEPLPDPETRVGDPRLAEDLRDWMGAQDLLELEQEVARQWVCNPDSGELVKGHLIVLAELGLAPFEGTIVRDPALFDGRGSRQRRAEHLVQRMAFVQALFLRLGRTHVVLHRGLSTEGPLEPPRVDTLVAASFSRAVATSHFESGSPGATRLLMSQSVPVERLVMTYYETEAMNAPFREAEAVLLQDDAATLF